MSGDHFCVQVKFSEKNKWRVKFAVVRENDVGVDIPIDDWLKTLEGKKGPAKKLKGEKITPFRSQWVANLIKSVIKDSPGKN